MDSNRDRQHYARQNTTRRELAELQEALNLRPGTPPYWYGHGAGWPEWFLATDIDTEKIGRNVGNNLKIGDVVWMLTPPARGSPMGVIVDYGRKGFVRIRNSNSSNDFDFERKPEHLLYNDRFQTGLDEHGHAYRYDPRHYMHTITLDHVSRQNDRIAELEQRCKTLQKDLESKDSVVRVLSAHLSVSETKVADLMKKRTKAKKAIKALKQVKQQGAADGFQNVNYPSTITVDTGRVSGLQIDPIDSLSRDQHIQQPTGSEFPDSVDVHTY